MQKYTAVKFVEEIKDGTEFQANEWPLHVTITGNFIVKYNDALINSLSSILRRHSSFDVVAAQDDLFGVNSNTLVTLIEPSKEILTLHNDIISELALHGALFDEPHYTKGGYRPHITVQRNYRLHKGERLSINQVSIVDMFPHADMGMRKVLATLNIA